MAQMILNIADAHENRVVNGVCGKHGYDLIKLPGETKPQFAKRMTIKFLKDCMKALEGGEAAQAARSSKELEIEEIAIS